jgi:hypothetical protein
MKLEVGKSYKDRQGTVWNAVGRSLFNMSQPFICENERGAFQRFSENGSFYSTPEESNLDLVEEYTPLLEGWVNVYGGQVSSLYPTKDAADSNSTYRLRCVKMREVRE